jgi:hypothetical protein
MRGPLRPRIPITGSRISRKARSPDGARGGRGGIPRATGGPGARRRGPPGRPAPDPGVCRRRRRATQGYPGHPAGGGARASGLAPRAEADTGILKARCRRVAT